MAKEETKTVTKARAAQEALQRSAGALAELPGTIRRGGEARKRAAEIGAAEMAGAALRRGGTGALTSGAAVGALADVGARTRAAAAAEMAAAEERAVGAEGQLGLQQAALYEAAEEFPGTPVDVYIAEKSEFHDLITAMLGDNWNVNNAMADQMLAEVDQIRDPHLRQLWTDKLNKLKESLAGGGSVNVQRPWMDPQGNRQTLFDLEDDAYVSSLREQGEGGVVIPSGPTNPLD